MTVTRAEDGTIFLTGRCPVEDAETFVRLLSLDPSATVDWRECDHAHTAVIQLLLASRPILRGPPAAELLKKWIEPALIRGGARAARVIDSNPD
jgi:hypothetical protein